MGIAKIVIHAEICLRNGRPSIERQISAHFILQTRRWQDRIKQPLRGNFPANSRGREDRVSSFDVNTNAEDELQIRAEDICPADEKR